MKTTSIALAIGLIVSAFPLASEAQISPTSVAFIHRKYEMVPYGRFWERDPKLDFEFVRSILTDANEAYNAAYAWWGCEGFPNGRTDSYYCKTYADFTVYHSQLATRAAQTATAKWYAGDYAGYKAFGQTYLYHSVLMTHNAKLALDIAEKNSNRVWCQKIGLIGNLRWVWYAGQTCVDIGY